MRLTKEVDLTTGNLLKKLILYVIPLILTAWLQLFFTSADLFTVSNFSPDGSTSVAAIGSNNSLINLIISVFVGLTVGCNVVCAAAKGSGDKEKASRAVQTSLLLGIISGIIVCIIGYFLARPLLVLMNSPENIIDKAEQYLKIYFLGTPFLLIYNFGSSILRAFGDSKKPLIILSISGVFNIGLNILLVVVFNLDVVGVGIATVISEFISACLVILVLVFDKNMFVNFKFNKLKLYKEELKEIIRIGALSGLSSFIFSISNMMIQGNVNEFGDVVVSGVASSQNIEGYLWNAMNSFGIATTAFAAANYGANKKDNIKIVLRNSLISVTILGIVMGGIMILLHEFLLNLLISKNYSNYQEIYDAACTRFYIIVGTYFTCGIMDTMNGYLRGLKYSLIPTLVTLTGAVLIRIIFLATLYQLEFFHNPLSLYISYPVSWVITIAIYFSISPTLTKKAFIEMDKQK